MKVVLHERDNSREIDALEGERLLYCGLRHGIRLPYECASGTCGTCKAKLISGEVFSCWQDAPGNRYVKKERNEFLMCQSVVNQEAHIEIRPAVRSPVTLPVPQILQGVISGFEQLTEDVAIFDYVMEQPLQYLAGQFVTLNFDGLSGYRAYSMTNFSKRPTNVLKFVVKRIKGGGFTEWLFSQNRNGTELRGFGALGRAVFTEEIEGGFIVLVGGTGIAGIMSILEHSSSSGHLAEHPVQLVFGLNRPQDGFFLGLLNQYCERHNKLRVIVALLDMDGQQSLANAYPKLEYTSGYLHEAANEAFGDLSEYSVAYLAGPPPAVDASLRMLLAERKFSARKIRFDKFA